MIKLSRLDGEPFILNAELIRYVEARPDTFITLTSGERVVVAETMDEVLLRAITYQQNKHLIPAPGRAAPDALVPPSRAREPARAEHPRPDDA
ncbi:MAG: flagellar FlbD family protein [Planctomycetota bacterium]